MSCRSGPAECGEQLAHTGVGTDFESPADLRMTYADLAEPWEALEAGEIVSIEVVTGIQPKSRARSRLGRRQHSCAPL